MKNILKLLKLNQYNVNGVLLINFIIGCFIIILLRIIKLQKIKIENLELNNIMLSKVQDDIKGFKHDFFNFVQVLDGYSQNNDLDGIKKMSESILKECQEINNIELLNSNLINDPGIYSILAKKYYIAKKENIQMNIEVFINIKEIKCPSFQLCRIIAIFLDNAIEAAKECDEKIINIRFIKDLKANKDVIIIENSYKRYDINIDRIFEKGYSTKENTKDHGLGLWNVKKILNATKNLSLFTKKEELFCQQLEIYN